MMERSTVGRALRDASAGEIPAVNDLDDEEPDFATEGLSYELAILNEKEWEGFRQQAAVRAQQELSSFIRRVKEVHEELQQVQSVAREERFVQERVALEKLPVPSPTVSEAVSFSPNDQVKKLLDAAEYKARSLQLQWNNDKRKLTKENTTLKQELEKFKRLFALADSKNRYKEQFFRDPERVGKFTELAQVFDQADLQINYELDTLRNALVLTKKQLSVASEELLEATHSAGNSHAELERLRAEMKGIVESADVQELLRRNVELEEKYEELEQQLHRANQDASTLQVQLTSSHAKIKGAEEEARMARAEKAAMTNMLATKEKEQRASKQQVSQLQAEVARLKAQAEKASQAKQAVSDKPTQPRQDDVDWKKKVRELQARYDELRTTCNVLTKKLLIANEALAQHDVQATEDTTIADELVEALADDHNFDPEETSEQNSEGEQEEQEAHEGSITSSGDDERAVPEHWYQSVIERICQYVGAGTDTMPHIPGLTTERSTVSTDGIGHDLIEGSTQTTARAPDLTVPAHNPLESSAPLSLLDHPWKDVVKAFVEVLHGSSDEKLRYLLQYRWPGKNAEVASVSDFFESILGVQAIKETALRDAQRCARLEREMQKSNTLVDGTFADNQGLLRTIADYERIISDLQSRPDMIDKEVLQELTGISTERVRRLTKREQLQKSTSTLSDPQTSNEPSAVNDENAMSADSVAPRQEIPLAPCVDVQASTVDQLADNQDDTTEILAESPKQQPASQDALLQEPAVNEEAVQSATIDSLANRPPDVHHDSSVELMAWRPDTPLTQPRTPPSSSSNEVALVNESKAEEVIVAQAEPQEVEKPAPEEVEIQAATPQPITQSTDGASLFSEEQKPQTISMDHNQTPTITEVAIVAAKSSDDDVATEVVLPVSYHLGDSLDEYEQALEDAIRQEFIVMEQDNAGDVVMHAARLQWQLHHLPPQALVADGNDQYASALLMSGELQNLREGIADSFDVQSLAALRHSNDTELTKLRMLACWRGSVRGERLPHDVNQLHLWARVEIRSYIRDMLKQVIEHSGGWRKAITLPSGAVDMEIDTTLWPQEQRVEMLEVIRGHLVAKCVQLTQAPPSAVSEQPRTSRLQSPETGRRIRRRDRGTSPIRWGREGDECNDAPTEVADQREAESSAQTEPVTVERARGTSNAAVQTTTSDHTLPSRQTVSSDIPSEKGDAIDRQGPLLQPLAVDPPAPAPAPAPVPVPAPVPAPAPAPAPAATTPALTVTAIPHVTPTVHEVATQSVHAEMIDVGVVTEAAAAKPAHKVKTEAVHCQTEHMEHVSHETRDGQTDTCDLLFRHAVELSTQTDEISMEVESQIGALQEFNPPEQQTTSLSTSIDGQTPPTGLVVPEDSKTYITALEAEISALQEALHKSQQKVKAHKRYQLKLVSATGDEDLQAPLATKLQETEVMLQAEQKAHQQFKEQSGAERAAFLKAMQTMLSEQESHLTHLLLRFTPHIADDSSHSSASVGGNEGSLPNEALGKADECAIIEQLKSMGDLWVREVSTLSTQLQITADRLMDAEPVSEYASVITPQPFIVARDSNQGDDGTKRRRGVLERLQQQKTKPEDIRLATAHLHDKAGLMEHAREEAKVRTSSRDHIHQKVADHVQGLVDRAFESLENDASTLQTVATEQSMFKYDYDRYASYYSEFPVQSRTNKSGKPSSPHSASSVRSWRSASPTADAQLALSPVRVPQPRPTAGQKSRSMLYLKPATSSHLHPYIPDTRRRASSHSGLT